MSLFISAIIIIAITRIPIIHKYVKLLTTFIHESGHGIFALVTLGGINRIKLNSDTSGYAITTSKWWVGRLVTAFAGYPFSTFFPSLMLYLLYKQQAAAVLWTLSIMLAVAILLWLRDLLSLAWALPITTIFILALRYSWNLDWLLFILMVIILVDSISSTFTIAKLSLRDHKNAGDATAMSELTFIPAQVWGIIFIGTSFTIAIYTLSALLGWVPDYYAVTIDFLTDSYKVIHQHLDNTLAQIHQLSGKK
jgi:hypothetical protein